MGCSSVTKEDEQQKDELRINLRDEIVQMVIKNPFYKGHVKDFRKFMKNIKKENTKLINEKDYILEKMIEKYIDKYDHINQFMFKSVVNFSFKRFSNVFHENELDGDVVPIIFNIIFLFLTQRQIGIKKEMKFDLCQLFEKIKMNIKVTEETEKIKFKTGKFSFLIYNLIQMCSFCFLNFFCGPATLKIAGNFRDEDINIVFSEDILKLKMYQPDNINKIVNRHLNQLNIMIQPQIINSLILTQALQPISDYITENKDEEVFMIDSIKLIEIFDLLIDKMDYEYYIDLFFNIGNEN